jgi:hypothetical protein
VATVALVAGSLLLGGAAAIHLHLWSTGYRHIPTIGPLFLVQAVAGIAVALVNVVVRRAWSALAGSALAVGTMAGLTVSVTHGLFGFRDSWSAPDAVFSLVVEGLAALVLIAAAVACRRTVVPRPGIPEPRMSSGTATAPKIR